MIGGNFAYLKNTDLKEYYDDIIKAQCSVSAYPDMTKIILRKIIEDILRKVAEKYHIDSSQSIRDLITEIKYNFNIYFPENICKFINTIRFNGINRKANKNEETRIFSPVDLLKMANKVFIWYLKDIEKLENFHEQQLVFVLPDNLERSIYEREKILNDIVDKEFQINNLREKIIDLAKKSQDITGLNRVVMAIKEEKNQLLKKQQVIDEYIKNYKKNMQNIEQTYDGEINKLNTLIKEYEQYESLVGEKEDKLVKAEVSNQDFKMIINNFEGEREDIVKYELRVNESIDRLRKLYKNIVMLCKEYKDILASIHFAYRDDYKKLLKPKESHVKNRISNENRLFDEEIIVYFNNVEDAKKNVNILTKLMNDKINRNIKYRDFYKGFLNLKEDCLRDIYILSDKYTLQTIFNGAKGAFGKIDMEKAQEIIKNRREEIGKIADEELKIQLYYRFANICGLSDYLLTSRKSFIENLNNIIEKAFDFLNKEEPLKLFENKLKSIKNYYIEMIINKLEKLYMSSQITITEDFVHAVYRGIMSLDESERTKLYDCLGLIEINEFNVLNLINTDAFKVMRNVLNLDSKLAYTCIYSFLYMLYYRKDLVELEDFLSNEVKLKVFIEKTLVKDIFLTEDGFNIDNFEENQRKLLSLFIFQIIATDEIIEQYTNLEGYTSLYDYWVKKQQQYNDLIIYEKRHEMDIAKLLNEKEKLNKENENTAQKYILLSSSYNKNMKLFKDKVLASDKIEYLPSYINYMNLVEKKGKDHENLHDMQMKLDNVRIALETGVWKDFDETYEEDNSIKNVQNLLIEEAKRSMYFEEEYKVLLDIEKDITNINEISSQLRKNIQANKLEIMKKQEELENCRKQIDIINDIYPDIEAAYWV